MPFALPDLPYPYEALEPYIDSETMRLHHDEHHRAYIDKANAALGGTEWAESPVEEVLQSLSSLPVEKQTVVRNNAGGHYNHSLFWQIMAPAGGAAGREPGGRLGEAIRRDLGSFEAFRKQFSEAGVGQFGSGWTWLVRQPADGGLQVVATPNQDSPLLQDTEPLLGIDVWEHAYYLKYQNRRAEYIAAWWNIVNWPAVEERYSRQIG